MSVNHKIRFILSISYYIDNTTHGVQHNIQILHPPNLSLIREVVQTIQIIPPFEKHSVTNELEPRRKLETRVIEHGFEVIRGNILCVLDFIWVGVECNICLNEQDVVDLMFTPRSITWG